MSDKQEDPAMRHYRLTINRKTGRATVERRIPDCTWRAWRYLGVVVTEEHAETLIREGWPDSEGKPTEDPAEPFTLEVVR